MTDSAALPRHVAVIMDGNGRWAQQRRRPRAFGHKAGQEAAEALIRTARERGVRHLTLFAFSSENWQRPPEEVQQLFRLLALALERQVGQLLENDIRLRFIGDLSRLSPALRKTMADAEAQTAHCEGMYLNIAVSYGGRWDIAEAARRLALEVERGELPAHAITPETFRRYLALGDTPDPDLFIRTGGESRVSNFLLWNLAYSELYFSDCLWPDFDAQQFDAALAWYVKRQRRFGTVPVPVDGSSASA